MTSLMIWFTLRTFLPVVILIILLQLWSLKSDYQIREPYKWHSWSSVCVWNVNVQGIKWKLIWSTLFPQLRKRKKGPGPIPTTKPSWPLVWSITHIFGKNMSNMSGHFSRRLKKWWNLPRSMCVKEQAPLLNSTFRQTLIFLFFPKCANGLYDGLCEAVRTALKWSVLVELDRHPIQSNLFNTETKGTEPSVRFTEVSEGKYGFWHFWDQTNCP